MSASNKKQVAELQALRDTLNKADRKKDYPVVVEACLAIIALDQRAASLNIMACLYHKDLGEAYLRLHEYEKALASFNTAREGLMEFRATKKLKFPDDWLNELNLIEKLIHKTETVHLR